MSAEENKAGRVEELLNTPDLADALESDRFKQFLDHVPVAIVVAELGTGERITYANLEFERLTGQSAAQVDGKAWEVLRGSAAAADDDRSLSAAVDGGEDYVGIFRIEKSDGVVEFDVWSNIIQDDDGEPRFRLVALAGVGQRHRLGNEAYEQRIRDKDTLLRELQHRVKNNLQMITALIRLEARNLPEDAEGERMDRLAGRIDALGLLYKSLSGEDGGESIDLGAYLSEIAAAVMHAHAMEGVRLDLRVDSWPVSINVAMPAGLVVNELLTNSLKHAFVGRQGGTITLHSLVEEDGCRVIVADDGIGLSDSAQWPKAGKLGSLIVQSMKQNAKARVEVQSAPGEGMSVTIYFARAAAAPNAA